MWVESLFDDFKRRCVCHDVCCPTNTYPSEDQHHYQRKQKLNCQRQQNFTNCQFVKTHMKNIHVNSPKIRSWVYCSNIKTCVGQQLISYNFNRATLNKNGRHQKENAVS